MAAPEALSSLSSGAAQSCGIGTSGALFCWGQNGFSQLGFTATEECFVPDSPGSFACAFTPGQVSLPGAVRDVAAGGNHTCAVLVSGEGYCWGSWFTELGRTVLYYGQLGYGSVDGSITPVRVSLDEPLQSITATKRDILGSTCGLTEGGRAFCWGANVDGALGAPSTDTCTLGGDNVECSLDPIAVETEERFTQLGLGESFACGLTDEHRVLCWGRNDSGQLGDGTTMARSDPQPVRFLR